jgi:hypothetical protein
MFLVFGLILLLVLLIKFLNSHEHLRWKPQLEHDQ